MIDKWDIYTDALNFYGIESQKAMLVEEVGELPDTAAYIIISIGRMVCPRLFQRN